MLVHKTNHNIILS